MHRHLTRTLRRLLLCSAVLLTLPCAKSQPINLTPDLLTTKNAYGEVRMLLFPWDSDRMLSVFMEPEWSYDSLGAQGVVIDPGKEFATVKLTPASSQGVPATFDEKEDVKFYNKLVLDSLPERAVHSGQVKQTGSFTSDPAAKSDAFGLVYALDGRKFAFAMGFINYEGRDSQIRYILNAPVEVFEEVHSKIRLHLGQLDFRSRKDIDAIRTAGELPD